VWQKLSQSWGVPVNVVDLAESLPTRSDAEPEASSGLVAHSGILDMAQELYVEMRPHLLEHTGTLLISMHTPVASVPQALHLGCSLDKYIVIAWLAKRKVFVLQTEPTYVDFASQALLSPPCQAVQTVMQAPSG
jgi:hypothetical protein